MYILNVIFLIYKYKEEVQKTTMVQLKTTVRIEIAG